MSGDLRAVLADRRGGDYLNTEDILAALADADEPLTATVEVRRDVDWDAYGESGAGVLTERVRIVAMTEDVLRARVLRRTGSLNLADAIVNDLLGDSCPHGSIFCPDCDGATDEQ